jgi:predicted small lipoprotein YifL
MPRIAVPVLTALGILMLTPGCGLKGPLYLPTAEQLERESERQEELRKRREAREQEAEEESAEREQRQTY